MSRSKKQGHFIGFFFPIQAYKRLLEIRLLAGARTNAAVVREALRYYEFYLKYQKEGYRIQLAKDDHVIEIEIE